MRLLTLIRHAKSSWDDDTLSDFERPLNERGRRDAPAMAERLAPELERPLRIVTSPAVRALSTARQFAIALRIEESSMRIEPRIYEASAGSLLAIVNALPDAEEHVLMFGHNPGFSDLGRLLVREPFTEMPTCAVATIAFDEPHWRDIVPGAGRLLRYRFPKEGRR